MTSFNFRLHLASSGWAAAALVSVLGTIKVDKQMKMGARKNSLNAFDAKLVNQFVRSNRGVRLTVSSGGGAANQSRLS